VAEHQEVVEKYQDYLAEENEMLKIIEQNSYFLPQDSLQEIIILDFTNFNRPGYVIKNLAYLLYPQALAAEIIVPDPFSQPPPETTSSGRRRTPASRPWLGIQAARFDGVPVATEPPQASAADIAFGKDQGQTKTRLPADQRAGNRSSQGRGGGLPIPFAVGH
jgi:hypothetical protein